MPVSPEYERNPGGKRITGSGQSATFPAPDNDAVMAIGSPTRPLGGSSRRSNASPWATTGWSSAGRRRAGSANTVTGTVSLRREYRSSRRSMEKLSGSA